MDSIHAGHDCEEFIRRVSNNKIVVSKLMFEESRCRPDGLLAKNVSPATPQPPIIQPKHEESEGIVKLVCVRDELIEHEVQMVAVGKPS